MAPRAPYVAGTRFGRLIVTSVHPQSHVYRNQRHRRYFCVCDCGTAFVAKGRHLQNGAVKSCGCLHAEAPWAATHGEGGKPGRTAEYVTWTGMKQRCLNPKHDNYPVYGGRGIKICDRWMDSFEAFLADMGRKPSPQHSIDRKDTDGNYEPDNCRWATPKEQANNRRV